MALRGAGRSLPPYDAIVEALQGGDESLRGPAAQHGDEGEQRD